MESLEQKEQFVELRAKGISFAKISEELGVSKTTLIDWSKDLAEQIGNYKAIEIDALRERYKVGKEHRVELFSKQLEQIRTELATRNLSDVPTLKLLEMQIKTVELLNNEDLQPNFQKTTTGYPLADFHTTDTWTA